jgi:hypothetical protein
MIDEEIRKKILDLIERRQGCEVKKEYTLRQLWGVEDTHNETYWIEYVVTLTDGK